MVTVPRTPQWAQIGVMALAHFTNDLYAAFLSPLLPLVVSRFDLSLALAGLLGTAFNMTSAFSQPLFGHAADRLPRPVFTVAGPLITASMMAALGVAPSYQAMLVMLLVAGIGTAAFHPQSFAMAGAVSGDRRAAGVSIFVAGGELGYALGPIYVAAIVTARGLDGTVLSIVPGLVACAVIWRSSRTWQASGHRPPEGSLRGDFTGHLGALALLWFIVVARSVIALAHILFIPLLLRQHGQSLILGGAAVFLFGGIGALGGLTGGFLADRLGRRAVLVLSLVGGVPLLWLFDRLQGGAAALLPLALGGFVFYLGAPVNVVMAQELLPRRASLASSLVTGMAWGTAGLSLTLIGAVADRIGLAETLAATLLLAVPALAAVWALPRPPRRPEGR